MNTGRRPQGRLLYFTINTMGNYIDNLVSSVKATTKFTYEEIAAKLGVTRKTLGRWRELPDEQIPYRLVEKLEKTFPEFVMERMNAKHSSIDLIRAEMLTALIKRDKLEVDDMVNRAANIFAHKIQIILKNYVVYKQSRCGAFPTTCVLKIQKMSKDKRYVMAVIKVTLQHNDYVINVMSGDTIVFGATLTDSAIIKAIKRIKGLFR